MAWAMQWVGEQRALPAFVFDRQRAQCEKCTHCYSRQSATTKQGASTIMQCKLDVHEHSGANGRNWLSCAGARAEGGVCGPDAARFERA